MRDFVSSHWASVVGLVASMSVVWTLFRIHDFPWPGLVWASLAFSAALLVRMRSNRSIMQLIDDIEAEPVQVVATPVRVAMPVAQAIL